VSPGRNPAQTSLCEPYRDEIAAMVQKGVCAKVISEELVGFKGGYASVKRFVRQLKADGGPPAPMVGSIHTGPGQEAQVDYGLGPMVLDPSTDKYRRTRLFVMTLGWSRKAVNLLAMASGAEVWADLHEKAFRALGGTTRVIVLANLGEGVKRPDYCDPMLNPQYRQVLAHYGVVGVPAKVRDPDRKGKVERGVGYAQLRLEHRRFDSLAEAQSFLDTWTSTVADPRIHGTTKRVVKEHFDEERPSLQPLPAEPCRRYRFGRRKVKTTGEVEIGTQTYAAPSTHVSIWVQVQHNDDVVRLLDEATGQLLVEHNRKAIDAPRAPPPEAGKQLAMSQTAELVQRGHRLGQNIGVVCAAVAATDLEEFAIRRLRSLLTMAEKFGADHVEIGCRVAIAAGAPTHRCVRAWLDHHPPAPLAQVNPLIRELTAYRDVVARRTSTTTTTTNKEH
jgi:transposase